MTKLIAIIDDESEMKFIYERVLSTIIQQSQIEIKFFSDSRLFDLWLRFNQPDLILCDIKMPYLSGPELGHRIRESGSSIPTYFVSGHSEEHYRETMKELGIRRFLTKPFNHAALLEILKSDLNLQG